MNNRTSPLVFVALLAVLIDQAFGQSQPTLGATKTIGSCVVVQTEAKTAEIPIGLKAVGSCQTIEGAAHSCTAEIVATGPDMILDVNDPGGQECLRLTDQADPCLSVDIGPLIFHSRTRATQSFNAGSVRVQMTTMIQQKRIQQTTTDLPPSPKISLNIGELFDVLKSRSSVAARLECSMADGDQRVFPILGEADLSPNIRFVSKSSSTYFRHSDLSSDGITSSCKSTKIGRRADPVIRTRAATPSTMS